MTNEKHLARSSWAFAVVAVVSLALLTMRVVVDIERGEFLFAIPVGGAWGLFLSMLWRHFKGWDS